MFWNRIMDSYFNIAMTLIAISLVSLIVTVLAIEDINHLAYKIELGMLGIGIGQILIYFIIKYIRRWINWQFIEPYEYYKIKKGK